MYVAAVTQCRV